MTTLPQPNASRLPQAGGSPPVMIQSSAQAGLTHSAAPPMTGADAWRVIRSNLWLIIAMLVVSGVAGYATHLLLAKYYPRYVGQGLLQIQPGVVDIRKGDPAPLDRSIVELEQRTQVSLLKTETLISNVVKNSDRLRETEWFRQFGNDTARAKKDLDDRISVSPIADTKLILVTFSWSNPKDCKTVVQEMVEEHLKWQRQTNSDRQGGRTKQLNELKGRYQWKQQELTQQLREKAEKLAISGMGVSGHLTAKEVEVADLVKIQLDKQGLADTARGEFESANAQVQQGNTLPQVEELLNRDNTIYNYKQNIDFLDSQLSDYLAKLGPDHPSVLSTKMKKESYEHKLMDRRAELSAQTTAALLDSLRGQAMGAQQAVDSVKKQVEAVQKELAGLANDLALYLTLRDEDQTYRELLKQVDEQLDVATQAAQTGVGWARMPEEPETMSFPQLPVIMSLAIALGLGLSLGIAFLRELLDTSVRSPRDIARVGQMNLLGMVADEDDDPQAAGARLPLVIFEAPNSMMAEQLRQVRTRLQHAASLDTTRSILVTSPSPDDGKSTIATNLAAGLALNGRRILLVDANFRRPQIHKIFGLSNERGFSDALNSLENFAGAAQETPVPNLSVMPCGPKSANPTELLESQLLTDFIERALEHYDHVIFDSGPLLFVSETVALAPRVDGVITVVRARSNSRGLLQRMRDALRQLKAEHLGVVLNAVRAQGGGYYARNIKTYYQYQNGHT